MKEKKENGEEKNPGKCEIGTSKDQFHVINPKCIVTTIFLRSTIVWNSGSQKGMENYRAYASGSFSVDIKQ